MLCAHYSWNRTINTVRFRCRQMGSMCACVCAFFLSKRQCSWFGVSHSELSVLSLLKQFHAQKPVHSMLSVSKKKNILNNGTHRFLCFNKKSTLKIDFLAKSEILSRVPVNTVMLMSLLCIGWLLNDNKW